MSNAKFFNKLNYTLANEDTHLEREIVKEIKPKKILSVCGSGGRTLPLIHDPVEEIIAVDISPRQLDLLDLRLESFKKLNYQDFLKFWGFAPYHQDNFKELRYELLNKLELIEETKIFFTDLFSKHHYKSILYLGKWEKTFALFSKVVRLFLRQHAEKLFSFTDIEAQKEYLDKEFPWKKWHLVMQILGNKSMFNALLYKGDFVKKNIKSSYFDFYKNSFRHLFYQDLARNNFFLQLCFWGEILFPEGNPVEAKEDVFNVIKNGTTKITKFSGDLISIIKEQENLDFISMSDVPSYFSGENEKNFLSEIIPSLNDGAIVVIRSYLRIPEVNRDHFEIISEKYKDLITNEKVNVYDIEVLKYVKS